mgnify:FL=1
MKFYTSIILLISFSLLNRNTLSAQEIVENNYGINGGIIIAIGNKIDRIGISINAYYLKNNIQVNPEFRVYYNFKNLGPKKQYIEAHAALGVVYGYGKKNYTDTNFFFSSVSNHTYSKNSIGYSFNYYFNPIGTSQQTGILSFQFNQFSFLAENDIFARPQLDRYRTGAFLFQYRKEKTQFGINSTLFTGQMGSKIHDEKYPRSNLYESNAGGKYTASSHGLLSAQIQHILPNHHKIQANLGIDAERVRHAIQNRLIHDQIFLPKKWRSKSGAHIPMLDQDGKQFLFKDNQKVKKPSIYLNMFSNPSIFY